MKKTFLICPVRGHDPQETEAVVKKLEADGWTVHWPPRDTNQEDPTGLRICRDNCRAIIEAGNVHIIWDGKSEGGLFDMGMAFMADVLLPAGVGVYVISLPPTTDHKSFQNMVLEWSCLNYYKYHTRG